MIGLLAAALPSIFKLGDKLIVDKDKKAEYAYKVQEMSFKLIESIVTMKTIPWVDAFVKVLVALVSLARPLGSFYLTIMGVDMVVEAGEVDLVSGGLASAFPTWMGAREVNKARKHKEKLVKSDDWDDWDD